MEAQKYLEILVNEAKTFMEKTIMYRRAFDTMFQDVKPEEVQDKIYNFDDDKLREYFQSSEILIDSQIIFQKIASFIYFTKALKIELDLEPLSQVNGLLDFITNHKPFETRSIITPEGELQEKNNKVSDAKFKEFKLNIQRAKTMIDERGS